MALFCCSMMDDKVHPLFPITLLLQTMTNWLWRNGSIGLKGQRFLLWFWMDHKNPYSHAAQHLNSCQTCWSFFLPFASSGLSPFECCLQYHSPCVLPRRWRSVYHLFLPVSRDLEDMGCSTAGISQDEVASWPALLQDSTLRDRGTFHSRLTLGPRVFHSLAITPLWRLLVQLWFNFSPDFHPA